MIIGVDVDGVLRDLVGSLTRVYKTWYPNHEVKPINGWDLAEFFPIGSGIYDFLWRDHAWECLFGADRYRGALSFMESLQAPEHEIYLVTNQPTKQARLATIDWLEERGFLGLADGLLLFACRELSRRDVKLDVLLDDHEEDLAMTELRGVFVVCMDRPWNQAWLGNRIKAFGEFGDLLRVAEERSLSCH